MRKSPIIFDQSQPAAGIALIVVATALGLLWSPSEVTWWERGGMSALMGLGAWALNAALVYRSGYLQGGYVLGWLWVLSMLTLLNSDLSWPLLFGAAIAVLWMARVFLATHWHLHDLTWVGIVSAMWLWWDPATAILIPMSWVLWPAMRAMRSRHALWLLIGQVIALGLTWSVDMAASMVTGEGVVDWMALLDWWWEAPDWQIFNHWLIVPLLMMALFQTPRALTFAKKSKSKAIALSWAAIVMAWAGYSLGPGNEDVYMGIMAVAALPQVANVQRYSLTPRWRSFLTPVWLLLLLVIRWWMTMS